ncbi:MAG: hypothetical protein IPF96_06015 [Rhodobacter sp.]|nr:hypothetical protein [Rhodobacter sp.]
MTKGQNRRQRSLVAWAASDPSAKRKPEMSKEKNKGGREAKKPKKEKVKILATANSNAGKDGTVIAGKKVK